jgi:hypothetical protein
MSSHRFSAAVAPAASFIRVPLLILGLLLAASPLAGALQEPGPPERAAIEVRVGETWIPAVLAHSITQHCTSPRQGTCPVQARSGPAPLDGELEPAERLLPDAVGGYVLRVEAGWDRLEIRSVSHPALDPITVELQGEAVDEFPLPFQIRLAQRSVACLERRPTESLIDRACYRFGRVPLDWGQPIGIEAYPVETAPPGAPLIAIFLDGEWVEPPFNSETTTSGGRTVVGDAFPSDENHPAWLLTPSPVGGPFRVFLAAGWDDMRLRRWIPPTIRSDFAGPDHRALEEIVGLARDSAHEFLIPAEGDPGERWSVCVAREDPESRTSRCYALRFAGEEG